MNESSGEMPPITQEAIQKKPQIDKSDKYEVVLDIEKIKKKLIDPRTISREHDGEGRSTIAAEVKQTRTESRSVRDTIPEIENALQETEEKTEDLYLQRGEKVLQLEQRLEKLMVRLKMSAGIKDRPAEETQEEINAVEAEIGDLLTQSRKVREELESLKQKQTEIPDPKKLLEAYYEKVETTPLSNKEKRKLLTPEVLASMSTEEYIAAWRRLNPHFLSHVTRQGFRDHNAMIYHSAGLEEFHRGFESVLEDDKLLRPPIALQGLRSRNESSVQKFLDGWALQAEDEKQAKERLHNLLNFSLASAPNYPDKTAVHFATQIVADSYYGGEKNNEVFFMYPSDVLASQYGFAFNGWEKDFTQPQSEDKWNDVFVWPDSIENPGIPLDSGIVFLPETTAVDPDTGSKYASEVREIDGEERRVMIEDKALVSSFLEWGKKLDNQTPLMKVFAEYEEERNYYTQQDRKRACLDVFRQQIQKIGFNEDAAAELGNTLFGELHWQKELTDEVLQEILRKSGANWKRAENTLTSKEYWEAYFAKNPQLRPKHIVYYDGDPTTAVYDFLKRENIGRADTSESDGKLLGFDDNHVTNIREDPRANAGYDELLETADKIISSHYEQ